MCNLVLDSMDWAFILIYSRGLHCGACTIWNKLPTFPKMRGLFCQILTFITWDLILEYLSRSRNLFVYAFPNTTWSDFSDFIVCSGFCKGSPPSCSFLSHLTCSQWAYRNGYHSLLKSLQWFPIVFRMKNCTHLIQSIRTWLMWYPCLFPSCFLHSSQTGLFFLGPFKRSILGPL